MRRSFSLRAARHSRIRVSLSSSAMMVRPSMTSCRVSTTSSRVVAFESTASTPRSRSAPHSGPCGAAVSRSQGISPWAAASARASRKRGEGSRSHSIRPASAISVLTCPGGSGRRGRAQVRTNASKPRLDNAVRTASATSDWSDATAIRRGRRVVLMCPSRPVVSGDSGAPTAPDNPSPCGDPHRCTPRLAPAHPTHITPTIGDGFEALPNGWLSQVLATSRTAHQPRVAIAGEGVLAVTAATVPHGSGTRPFVDSASWHAGSKRLAAAAGGSHGIDAPSGARVT